MKTSSLLETNQYLYGKTLIIVIERFDYKKPIIKAKTMRGVCK